MNNTISHNRLPDAAYFLNRLALEYSCNPHKLPLVSVLQDFFDYTNLQGHFKMFNQFCSAAMQQQYTWTGGSPGNGLFYAERLELLIETAYLLHIRTVERPKAKRKIRRLSKHEFPMYLNSNEYRQPFAFLDSFFNYATLQRWKKMLNAFTCNALSNSSVAEELPPEELFPFVCYTKKLICAAYLITRMGKKNE